MSSEVQLIDFSSLEYPAITSELARRHLEEVIDYCHSNPPFPSLWCLNLNFSVEEGLFGFIRIFSRCKWPFGRCQWPFSHYGHHKCHSWWRLTSMKSWICAKSSRLSAAALSYPFWSYSSELKQLNLDLQILKASFRKSGKSSAYNCWEFGIA